LVTPTSVVFNDKTITWQISALKYICVLNVNVFSAPSCMHVTVLTQAKLRNELFGDIAPGVLILAAVLYALCGGKSLHVVGNAKSLAVEGAIKVMS